MSSATPPQSSPATAELHRLAAACADRVATGVRAMAFWSAALLPLVIVTALFSGAIGMNAVGTALAVNAACAIVGHSYTPNA
ncbi:hypothetical protein HWV23_13555 [Natronomonas halophila]|uniref:hypothetical protein n=1 Tax=Natronomonas halophila TaxID=2747817 RepID=UPI0015B6F1B7|nr:hypothetical protein [Natronomonas halophila]QLD86711.1 hypothetical protein HWV23_13555 [Natronomonas halophila]